MMVRVMDEPQPRVVEVTRIVPAEDVPYVAARVAERLGMPLERVRKLIEGRTGPITRPLRPDKAEAIAQTFEAAGVAVVIRPATEADDAVMTEPQAQPEGTEVGGPVASDEAVSDRDDAPSEAEPAVATAEPDVSEADVGDTTNEEIEAEALDPPDPDDWDDLDPVDADAGDASHGVVMEVDDAPDEVIAPEPTPWSGGGVRFEAPDQQRTAPVALDPDDDLDETNDPGVSGLPARGEVRVRIEHDPEADTPWTSEPGGVGLPGVRNVPVPAAGGPAVLADAPEGETPAGRGDGAADRGAPFGDPATWGGDDPAGGWIIGARTTRRFEVLHDDEPVSELPGAEPDVTDEVLQAPDEASDDTHDDAAAATSPPWRGQPGIGRAYRRPQDVASTPSAGRIRVEHDEPALDTADAPQLGAQAGEGVVTEDGPEIATTEGAARDVIAMDAGPERDDVADEGTPARGGASERPGPPPVPAPARRVVPMPPMRPPAPRAATEPQPEVESASDARSVPTAWRGLGGDERGPARPVDARLPTRAERSFDERVRIAGGERVTRRRTAMLIALAIALALFVVAQAWVAGRAAPAFDAGLHRFRDADFGAAQRVWVQLAEHGDANAQFMLGYLSEAGLGRPWSARAAASWYRLAADAGHAEARWRLGLLYEIGLGVPHDPVDAMRWWAAAADAGHAEAAFRLGRARLEGRAGASDVEGALAAFDRALTLGWPAARPYRDALMIASSGGAHPGALP